VNIALKILSTVNCTSSEDLKLRAMVAANLRTLARKMQDQFRHAYLMPHRGHNDNGK